MGSVTSRAMPFPFVASHSAHFWPLVTRFGEAQLMLLSALALVAWLVWLGERRTAAIWASLVGLAVALTTTSKIAFIGWGVGVASLNFTGVSGHAMHAAAVFPLLLYCFTSARGHRAHVLALMLGLGIAALVAVSRVVIGAHSPSESIAGFLVGGAASGLAVVFGRVPRRPLPHWLIGLLAAAMLLSPTAAPSLPTHDMVTHLALWVSGHEKPYTRKMMLQRERERQKALHGLTGQTAPPLVPTPSYSASAVVFFTSSITA